MIALNEYLDAVLAKTGIDLTPANDETKQQRAVVTAPIGESLFVVAGPGSGKTTASTLRILKLIYVDDVRPAEILATTFTRKAAKALRSKIVNYGEALRARFRATVDGALRERLDRIDLNGMRLGTLDSIAQDVLTEFRPAGAPAPRPIEEFARTSVFVVRGVLQNGLQNSRNAIPALWNRLYGDNRSMGVAARAGMLKELHDRLSNDRVDARAWQAAHPDQSEPYHRGIAAALGAIGDVRQRYLEEYVIDFAGLSELFLSALELGELDTYIGTLRFILVDDIKTPICSRRASISRSRGRRGLKAVRSASLATMTSRSTDSAARPSISSKIFPPVCAI